MLGQYILKRSGELAVLQKSMRLCALLAAKGIPVPVYVGGPIQKDGAYYSLMKKLPGAHPDPYAGDAYANGVQLGGLVAELHGALREVPGDFECPDADCMKELEEYILPEIRVPRGLRDYAYAFGPLYKALPRQVIHRDPHTANMLFEGGTFTGWLDFDLSQRNARMLDLCYLGATLLVVNYRKTRRLRVWREIFRGVLDGYNGISPLSPEEYEVVPYLFVHVELLFAAFFSKNGQRKTSKSCMHMAKWLYRNRGILTSAQEKLF